jgi:hypothetical protein
MGNSKITFCLGGVVNLIGQLDGFDLELFGIRVQKHQGPQMAFEVKLAGFCRSRIPRPTPLGLRGRLLRPKPPQIPKATRENDKNRSAQSLEEKLSQVLDKRTGLSTRIRNRPVDPKTTSHS